MLRVWLRLQKKSCVVCVCVCVDLGDVESLFQGNLRTPFKRTSRLQQKRAHYVDHDRMADDTVWFPPESGGGLLHGPPMHHPPHQGGPMPARDPYDDSYMP